MVGELYGGQKDFVGWVDLDAWVSLRSTKESTS